MLPNGKLTPFSLLSLAQQFTYSICSSPSMARCIFWLHCSRLCKCFCSHCLQYMSIILHIETMLASIMVKVHDPCSTKNTLKMFDRKSMQSIRQKQWLNDSSTFEWMKNMVRLTWNWSFRISYSDCLSQRGKTSKSSCSFLIERVVFTRKLRFSGEKIKMRLSIVIFLLNVFREILVSFLFSRLSIRHLCILLQALLSRLCKNREKIVDIKSPFCEANDKKSTTWRKTNGNETRNTWNICKSGWWIVGME